MFSTDSEIRNIHIYGYISYLFGWFSSCRVEWSSYRLLCLLRRGYLNCLRAVSAYMDRTRDVTAEGNTPETGTSPVHLSVHAARTCGNVFVFTSGRCEAAVVKSLTIFSTFFSFINLNHLISPGAGQRRLQLLMFQWKKGPRLSTAIKLTRKINSSPLDRMAAISADDNFKCIFLNENDIITIRISLRFVAKIPIDNKPALVQIMAWRRAGDKPLPEPMLTRFTDAYMPH